MSKCAALRARGPRRTQLSDTSPAEAIVMLLTDIYQLEYHAKTYCYTDVITLIAKRLDQEDSMHKIISLNSAVMHSFSYEHHDILVYTA